MSTADEWSILEKLFLSQAVYKFGENNWAQVAHNLNQNTLLDRQPDFFNQEECSEQYSLLLNSIVKPEKQPNSTSTSTDEPPLVVQIARILHIQRLEELRLAIEETNEKYATLTNEIDAIRVGKWDDRLLAEDARKNQAIITMPERTEPMTSEDNKAKVVEAESMQIDDAVVTETLQAEEEAVQPQHPQEVQTATSPLPGATTTPMSMLDNDSTANTPLEQGTLTPVEAVVNTPPALPPPQQPLPGVVTVSAHAVPTAEAIMSLASDMSDIMDSIENNLPEQAPVVETRQPETTIVPSVVEEPTPEQVLEAASVPHVTSQPTISAHTLDDAPGSEEGFHSAAAEIEPKVKLEELEAEQQLPAPPSPSPAPPLSPQLPSVPEETKVETNPTSPVISADEVVDTGKLNWSNELKRKVEEDAGAAIGESERHEIKRQRTGDGVTREITAETVLPNKEPSLEGAEVMSTETESMLEMPQLSTATTTTTTTHTSHQDADDQAKREESRSPDAVYPRSPEAPLSMTSGADAESVTGSESNAPTPTGSAPSFENKRTGSSSGRNKDEQRQQKSWQKNINLLWREITNHKNGAMFMNPIKEATAPSYYDIVKHPMDLKAIKNRIRDGVIKSTVEFERDIVLMLTNSLMYNKEGTEMYQMALEMLEDVTEQVKLFKTADSNSPPVSHTRKASTIAKDRRKSISDF